MRSFASSVWAYATQRLLRSLSLLPASVMLCAAAPGDIDTSFNPPRLNNWVRTVAVQSDGKIIIAGDFTQVGTTPRVRIARLLTDGAVDPTFDPGSGPDNGVTSVSIQADGKILLAGSFSNVRGTPRRFFARLNGDGTLDTGFAATQPLPFSSGEGRQILALSDGRALLVGPSVFFTLSPLLSRNGLMRLNANGTCDTAFTNCPMNNAGIFSVALTPAGKYLAGGAFDTTGGTVRSNLVQLETTGAVDPSFNGNQAEFVRIAQLTPGGGIMLSRGSFGTTRASRIHGDGSPDGGFAEVVLDGSILAMTIQPDSKTVIAGDFTQVNTTQRLKVARLNADGTVDTGFDPGMGAGTSVFSLALQTDGKILVGGAFVTFDDQDRPCLVRLVGGGGGGGGVGPRLTSPAFTGSTFSLSTPTQNGKTYTLQVRTNLASTATWSDASPSIAGDGTPKTLSDLAATRPAGFYRVQEQ